MNPEEYHRMYRMEDEHWYFRGKRRIVSELMRGHLPAAPSLRILDAGCGTGRMLKELQPLGEVFALDPFHDATVYSASRGFCNVVQAAVERIPFPDASFDLITSLDVIEHVHDDTGALRELFRVLKPGGVLMLTVPAHMFLWSGHDVALHHKRRYSRGEFGLKVISAGFRPIRISYFNTFLFPVVVAVRTLRRLAGRDRVTSDSSELPPSPVNRFLYLLMAAEALLISRMRLPAGVSLACVAQKAVMEENENEYRPL